MNIFKRLWRWISRRKANVPLAIQLMPINLPMKQIGEELLGICLGIRVQVQDDSGAWQEVGRMQFLEHPVVVTPDDLLLAKITLQFAKRG